MNKKKKSIEKFKNQVLTIESACTDIKSISEKIVLLANNYLSEKRTELITNGFENINEEIHFFKNEKQFVLNKLIYYSKIWEINSKLSLLSPNYKKKYLERKIESINKFFLKHLDFVKYVESGEVYLDEYYFTRCNVNNYISRSEKLGIFDLKFNTPRDRLLAKLNAYKELAEYLQDKDFNKILSKSASKLEWTSSKTSLTELIYALHSARVINNGTATLREITNNLQRTFNFEIGDIYRIFSDIRNRKTERTKFINELAFSVLNSMENLDN
jgi:hypothetical protein